MSSPGNPLPKALTKTEWILHKGLLLSTRTPESKKQEQLKKVDVNATFQGRTALHEACDAKSTEPNPNIVRFLLQHRAAPTLVDPQSEATALTIAVAGNQTAIVQVLLEEKVDVNAGGSLAPLYIAAVIRKIAIVKLLLKFNASVDIRTPRAETPLYGVVDRSFDVIAQAKVQGYSLQHLEALEQEFYQVFKILLEAGAHTGAKTSDNFSPFFHFVRSAEKQYNKYIKATVQLFFRHGARIDEVNGVGSTALSTAVRADNESLVMELLRGAKETKQNINAELKIIVLAEKTAGSQEDETASKDAQSATNPSSEVKAADTIVKGKEDEEAEEAKEKVQDKKPFVAPFDLRIYPRPPDHKLQEDIIISSYVLQQAVAFASDRIILALLEARADPKLVDSFGANPLHIACFLGRQKAIERITKQLNRVDGDLNAQNQQGLTCLHIVCHNGHDWLAKFLLQYREKLKINLSDHTGKTPLHRAAAGGHYKIVRLLLMYNTVVDVQDKDDGYTPLISAVDSGWSNVVEQLLEAGADPIASDDLSPLFIAIINGNKNIVKTLFLYFKKFFPSVYRKELNELMDYFFVLCEKIQESPKDISLKLKLFEIERNFTLGMAVTRNIIKFTDFLDKLDKIISTSRLHLQEMNVGPQQVEQTRTKFKRKHQTIAEELEESTRSEQAAITWFGGDYTASEPSFIAVDRAKNTFFHLAVPALQQQGCSENDLAVLQRIRLKFCAPNGESGIKRLTLSTPFEIAVKINGKLQQARVTCELKTLVFLSRVLCFEISSDKGDAHGNLILGAIFVDGGLHGKNELDKLRQRWTKDKPLVIDLPPSQKYSHTVVAALTATGFLKASVAKPSGKDDTDRIGNTILDYLGAPRVHLG